MHTNNLFKSEIYLKNKQVSASFDENAKLNQELKE